MKKYEDLPYRPCVGIMLLNRKGLVFIGRRTEGPEHVDDTHAWQMPQGGVDADEDPWPAARRELYEETNVTSVEKLAESSAWFSYDIPRDIVGQAWKGKYRGQTQKWFAYRFEGDESEIAINPPPGGHTAEFDRWEWKPMADLPELIVPFKRKVYEEVVAAFRHLAG